MSNRRARRKRRARSADGQRQRRHHKARDETNTPERSAELGQFSLEPRWRRPCDLLDPRNKSPFQLANHRRKILNDLLPLLRISNGILAVEVRSNRNLE